MSKKKPRKENKRSGPGKAKKNKSLDLPQLDWQTMEAMVRALMPEFAEEGETSDLEAAQQIMYRAFEETDPREQIALAHRALELSPDCVDAYLLLADYAETLPEALTLHEQAVAAGERSLGKEVFDEYAGHFWGFHQTRPYMVAREGLADSLWQVGRREEAAEHCREMLRLNPNDNQGIRYRLAAMLFDLERHDELTTLLETYKDDSSAEWVYSRALLAFRQEGDTARARDALAAAEEFNAHVPAYLTQLKMLPREVPAFISPGGEDEAVSYAAEFLPAWKATPGAMSWLRKTLKLAHVAPPPKRRQPWNRLQPALARLPQSQDAIWEMDLRQLDAPGSETNPQWLLGVLNTSDGFLVHLDLFDDRPSDADVWDFLITAIRAPKEGEPQRPAELRIRRKTWFRAWRQKLQDIGVPCQLDESLNQFQDWFETAIPHLSQAWQNASEPLSSEQDWSQLESLPQRSEEIWEANLQRLPMWIEVEGEPARPWAVLVVDVESEAILMVDTIPQEPSPDWLLAGVWRALSTPLMGEPHRPGAIHVASDQQREILAARLEPLGIQCVVDSELQCARRLSQDLAGQFEGLPGPKALIHSPGVTPAQLGEFYAAAALFYRARPWRQTPSDSVIRVACSRFASGPWYAVVMGQSGIEQGLALYEDVEFLRRLLNGEISNEAAGRGASAISLMFGEAFDIAPEDADAAEEHGWPIAGSEAYPCVLRVTPGTALRTPLKWELELLEGCLRTFPDFLGRDVDRAEIPVTVSGEQALIQLERVEHLDT